MQSSGESNNEGFKLLCFMEKLRQSWGVNPLLVVFSDKYQRSLKARSLVFYQLHVKVFNFTEGWKRVHITIGWKLSSYLPMSF